MQAVFRGLCVGYLTGVVSILLALIAKSFYHNINLPNEIAHLADSVGIIIVQRIDHAVDWWVIIHVSAEFQPEHLSSLLVT